MFRFTNGFLRTTVSAFSTSNLVLFRCFRAWLKLVLLEAAEGGRSEGKMNNGKVVSEKGEQREQLDHASPRDKRNQGALRSLRDTRQTRALCKTWQNREIILWIIDEIGENAIIYLKKNLASFLLHSVVEYEDVYRSEAVKFFAGTSGKKHVA